MSTDQNSITPSDILDYWYSAEVKPRWFNSTPQLDEEIKTRFSSVWEQADAGELDSWLWSPEGCLALIIIFDQFPLNMFRGEPKSFKTEAKAVSVTKHMIEKGLDKQLDQEYLSFTYMPLMHSEDMDDQDLSVKMFTEAGLTNNARFAEHHRNIVKTYGRFPHRNAILGRESSPEEVEYLNSDQAFTG